MFSNTCLDAGRLPPSVSNETSTRVILAGWSIRYIGKAEAVIEDMKAGAAYSASFRDTNVLYRLEIVTIDGRETLEIVDVGQPEKYKSLRNLPLPG